MKYIKDDGDYHFRLHMTQKWNLNSGISRHYINDWRRIRIHVKLSVHFIYLLMPHCTLPLLYFTGFNIIYGVHGSICHVLTRANVLARHTSRMQTRGTDGGAVVNMYAWPIWPKTHSICYTFFYITETLWYAWDIARKYICQAKTNEGILNPPPWKYLLIGARSIPFYSPSSSSRTVCGLYTPVIYPMYFYSTTSTPVLNDWRKGRRRMPTPRKIWRAFENILWIYALCEMAWDVIYEKDFTKGRITWRCNARSGKKRVGRVSTISYIHHQHTEMCHFF